MREGHAELEEQMSFSLTTRFTLGYGDLSEGHFEFRTVYNFRWVTTPRPNHVAVA